MLPHDAIEAPLDLRMCATLHRIRRNRTFQLLDALVQLPKLAAQMRHIEAEQRVLREQRADDRETGQRGQHVDDSIHGDRLVRIVRVDHFVGQRFDRRLRVSEVIGQRDEDVHADEQKHEGGDQRVDAIVAGAFGSNGGVLVTVTEPEPTIC